MGRSLAWRTDEQLYDAVRHQLETDIGERARDIAIIAHDGVVTLTGFADSYAAKLAVDESVRRVHGARAIANDVEVRTGDAPTDPEIATAAVQALATQPRLRDHVTVTVRHGFVTIEGAVADLSQKESAGAALAGLAGVRALANLIQVAGAAK
jgi:osmotically-inducible protein OsmY